MQSALALREELIAIADELRRELFHGENPIDHAEEKHIDIGYPHTFIPDRLIGGVLQALRPLFWLEIGSLVGGSAIKVANHIVAQNLSTQIACIDPFCADVYAWFHEKEWPLEWKALRLEKGRSTLYERFLANIAQSGHGRRIVPMPMTSAIGLKLLRQLKDAGRISVLPSVIYLDSAHEPDETYNEIALAWSLLPEGGILIGDDWVWASVRGDVVKFAKTITQNEHSAAKIKSMIFEAPVEDGVMLCSGREKSFQWMLFK